MRNLTVGVCVLVVKNRRLLVARRRNEFGRNFLCVPGGHHEFGESIVGCGLRELVEEAGGELKVEIAPKYVYATAAESGLVWFTTNCMLEGRHCLTSWLHARWVSGNPVQAEPNKKDPWQWMSLDDIIADGRCEDKIRSGEPCPAFHWIPVPELLFYRNLLGI